jgi:hypothetical protein
VPGREAEANEHEKDDGQKAESTPNNHVFRFKLCLTSVRGKFGGVNTVFMD